MNLPVVHLLDPTRRDVTGRPVARCSATLRTVAQIATRDNPATCRVCLNVHWYHAAPA